MSEELTSPLGMTYSPVGATTAADSANQQVASNFEWGGTYHVDYHSDQNHTAAAATAETHVTGEVAGHSFHGDLEGGATIVHDSNGWTGSEGAGAHAGLHDAHSDSGSHGSHDSHTAGHDSGQHGSDAGHGGGHDGGTP